MEREKKQSLPMENFSSTAELTSNLGFQSSHSISSKDVNSDKPYIPFEHRQVEHPNSVWGSLLHLLKACSGTGMLAMPAAFKNAGLLPGSIGTIIAGTLCVHTMHIFVKTSQEACVYAKKPSMSFAETTGAAFTYGPKWAQKWGPTMKGVADYSMLLGYISVLCVYVVFIGSSLKEVLDVAVPGVNLTIQSYCALMFIPLVLLCQIRNIKFLVPFSGLANFLTLVVFIITMYYVFIDLPSPSDRVLVANVSSWPLFLSTVVFAMEGIGIVMPVENEMKKPQYFLGCPGVLNTTIFIVTMLYGFIGFCGYLQFGDEVKGSITLNLPEGDLIAQATKLLMAAVIFFTYATNFYVPMEMITRQLIGDRWKQYHNVIQISIRTGIVTFSVVIAALFPNLELVISLVGAVFFSTLGLLIPAVVDTVFHWDNLGVFNYVLFKNIIIGMISLLCLVTGASVSITNMIAEYGSGFEESHINATYAP